MRHLQPVDVVVDLDVPESGLVADDNMAGPYWSTQNVAQTFFGRNKKWILDQFSLGRGVFDGEQVAVPRRVTADWRAWRLVDIERFAHGLAQNGYITIDQLVRVIQQVKLVAESWGYIDPASIPVRIETYDPARQEVHAVAQGEEYSDDIDGTSDASPHTFRLDDVEYQIDLGPKNWHDLVAKLAPYIEAARRNDRDQGEDRQRRASRTKIRDWAKRNGYSVSDYGPIPRTVVRAYHTEQKS